MKAIELTETGGPEVMHLREIPTPIPQESEALIRVAVTGVNFIDLYVREGRYGNELPFTPGQEAAGTVVAVGKSVSHLQEGDRVAWCSVLGTYAEYAVAPAERVVPIPIGVTFAQAAAALQARHDCSLPFALGLPDPATGRGAHSRGCRRNRSSADTVCEVAWCAGADDGFQRRESGAFISGKSR